MGTLLLARQSIFSKDLAVYGYELLMQGDAGLTSVDASNTHVIDSVVKTINDIGLERIIGKHRAFIDCKKSLEFTALTNKSFPTTHVVVQISYESCKLPEALPALTNLRKLGYQIALDNFEINEVPMEVLKLVSIIRLDLNEFEDHELQFQIDSMRDFRTKLKIKLLANKVETHEVFKKCCDLGFDYFQGHFLNSPNLVKGQSVKANKVVVMQLLSRLQKEDVESSEIETVVSQDPRLSYKLLRMVNSAAFALPRKIQSLREAIIYLGLRNIRSWSTMISLSSVDDKPVDLLVLTMTRAKMCELLAKALTRKDSDSFFMIGLFSTLDALMDKPLKELLSELELDAEVVDALIAFSGIKGQVLKSVLAHEQGQWDEVVALGIKDEVYRNIYFDSLDWARQCCDSLRSK